VTTKVKGQGYVPINSTLKEKKNETDLEYYTQLFSFNIEEDLQILDTAGKNLLFKSNKTTYVFYISLYICKTMSFLQMSIIVFLL
jgi:hypothetical protein